MFAFVESTYLGEGHPCGKESSREDFNSEPSAWHTLPISYFAMVSLVAYVFALIEHSAIYHIFESHKKSV